MTKPTVSHRRIDQLRAIAFDLDFTNDDARKFGKLSKTDTWKHLLQAHGIDSDSYLATINGYTNTTQTPVDSAVDTCKPIHSFLEWVDFSQLIALTFASVGLFLLVNSVWQYNPLKFLPSPVRITIQIGQK